jgi:hypothetical protein
MTDPCRECPDKKEDCSSNCSRYEDYLFYLGELRRGPVRGE